MAAPYHNIEDKIEAAIEAWFLANGIGPEKATAVNLYQSFDAATPTEPFIEIAVSESDPAEEDPAPLTGNWACVLNLKVRTHKNSTTGKAQHGAIIAAMRDLLFTTTAVDDINAEGIDDFTIQILRVRTARREVEDNSCVTNQEVMIECFPS